MISEAMIKTLLKAIDFEKLQERLLCDPRVNEALILAGSIRDDFANIKLAQAEILSRLDRLTAAMESQTAKPAKRAAPKLIHSKANEE